MISLFISYSSANVDIAKNLYFTLDSHGIPVWMDSFNLMPGENWLRTLDRALNECTHLVLVYTMDSLASDEVMAEWRYFLDEEKPVIPILCDDTPLHYRLRTLQYVDLRRLSFDDMVMQLLSIIKPTEATALPPLPKPTPQRAELLQAARQQNTRGHSLLNEGNYEAAIFAHDTALRLVPDFADAYYDLACIYALRREITAALVLLEVALNKGFRGEEQINFDPDLDNLRVEARFHQLLNRFIKPS